jgi:hypothetical protein
MSTMPRKIGQGPVSMEGPTTSATDHVRDAIAGRSQRLDAAYPRALDLEARVVSVLHRDLAGLATALAGTHQPEHFREMLRGERSISLGTFCRLGVEPTREPREAFRDALSVMAAAIGYQLAPLDGAALDPHEVLARVAEAGGALMGEMGRAIEDNQLSDDEADRIEARNVAAKAATAQVDLMLLQARSRPRR